jgi:hypothetical protein
MGKQPTKKHYTYNLSVSFRMQFTFTENEVEPSEDGGPKDRDPSQRALENLEEELREHLRQHYTVDDIEVSGDFDDLLGIDEA